MEKDRCIAAIVADSAALTDAARLGLQAPVPSCPGWSVGDLVEHTGRVHRAVIQRVSSGTLEPLPATDISLPPRSELVGWFASGAHELVRVLEAAQTDDPAWNRFGQPQEASFWWRRMTQETAVHRWDGQAAHGQQQPVDTNVAVDGVDEFLDVFLARDVARTPSSDLGGTVSLHCTDDPAAWLVTVAGGTLRVRRGQHPGTTDDPLVSVSASASDLLLLVWRRIQPSASGVRVEGDAALLARFAALANL